MKRYMRKIAVALLAVMLFSALAGYASASWANISFNQYISGSSYTKLTDVGSKSDTSALYLYIGSGPNQQHRVRALGCATTNNSQTENLTVFANGDDADYVLCFKGTKYSIHSEIKENGYDFATLSIWQLGASGNVSGQWSPDSIGEYVDADMSY